MYKIIKLSKLAAALAFCSIVSVSEATATGVPIRSKQEVLDKINIHLKEGNASQALLSLSQHTGQGIGYDKQALKLENIAVKERVFQNASFDEVLSYILKNTNIQSKKVNGGVVLVRNKAQESFSLRVRVSDEAQQPIAGASVKVLSTNQSVLTNAAGVAEAKVPAGTYTILITHISYGSKELGNLRVDANTTGIRSVIMQANNSELGEVVVTALGIKRQDRSLGYAVGTIKGEDLSRVNNDNFMVAMAGKVPGVSISSTGPTGSSVNMVIRGASSLSTDNQPLFVVDGVPLMNQLGNIGQIGDDNKVDYGNSISNINPDDIENISILKGPSAAALYGSRAGNGVVLITTKSGKNAEKMTISVNSNNVFDIPYHYIDLHNKFASGTMPWKPGDISGDLKIEEESSYMVGPALDKGYKAIQWNSPLDENGNPIPTELKSYPNNIKNFVQTGITSTNGISLANRSERLDYRFSYSNMNNRGIVPNSDLFRNTLNVNSTMRIRDNLSLGLSLDASRNNSNNRPAGNRGTNPLQAAYEVAPHINILDLEDYWMPGQEGIQQRSQSEGNFNNPYFLAHGVNNSFVRDRVFGNLRLDWNIKKNWNLMLRYATDIYWENRETKIPYSYTNESRGAYGIVNLMSMEQNIDFLTTYNKKLGDFHATGSLGGNLRYTKGTSVQNVSKNGAGLTTPGLYSLSNISPLNLDFASSLSERAVNSVYGLINLSYRDMVYLDLTGRNDWSSTLPAANRSYFYPSASLSLLADQIFALPESISLFKLRGGIARVGNDTSPYNLFNVLNNPGSWGNVLRITRSSGLLLPNLKPEQATSYELGTDIGIWQNRLKFEGTYYTLDNKNQIISTALPSSSGFSSRNINAGLLSSRGLELAISGRPIEKENWTWDLGVNWHRNRTRIDELSEGVEFHTFWTDGRGGARTYVGEEIGDLYDSELVTVEDPSSPYYGYPILDSNGSWQAVRINNSRNKIGNFNPDFSMGLQSTLRHKKWSMHIAADMRLGGKFMSQTYRYFESNLTTQRFLDQLINPNGLTGESLRNYLIENDLVRVQGNRYPIVGGPGEEYGGYPIEVGSAVGNFGVFNPGVMAEYDAQGNITGYTENLGAEGTKYIAYSDNYPWDFMNAATFDASFIKLRELSFSYDLTGKWLTRLGIDGGSVGVYTRNLILWTKAKVGVDPEMAFQPDPATRGGFKQGIERYNVTPWAIPVGFKVNVTF
ncbi:SusC/RagA family TonB-linked outer membrane protein [Sphingobacterium alkalisoli]|uniref:SusC/RagA family TonB-linked outer membrane protein n=1 Tax=Sphingobacterium alkalisoli TaxID=1874115 RepID=A0A4U0H2L0_9SPHI|nr:SusC/RagA family TonB-linked outer membrane protein [Sphingobacterium alkalisoli]TJY65873.1 SusC/RagA family TonB-linked outer membrane protein [Sphingobacterium alkalisoli]GGH17747.1 SusC/RagA family TonB-linked outer membrane protein [Sphingobacterium alkalisoli]